MSFLGFRPCRHITSLGFASRHLATAQDATRLHNTPAHFTADQRASVLGFKSLQLISGQSSTSHHRSPARHTTFLDFVPCQCTPILGGTSPRYTTHRITARLQPTSRHRGSLHLAPRVQFTTSHDVSHHPSASHHIVALQRATSLGFI